MISKETIELVKNKLVEAYDPIAIYLFGSYVWGEPSEDSDLDLMIIVEDYITVNRIFELKGQFALQNMMVAKDILINQKTKFLTRATHASTLQYKIKNQAVKLYGNI